MSKFAKKVWVLAPIALKTVGAEALFTASKLTWALLTLRAQSLKIHYLKVQKFELRHLMKGVKRNTSDMIITKIQGNHGTQAVKSQFWQLCKIQSIWHFQTLKSITHFFKGLTVYNGYPVITQVHGGYTGYMSKSILVDIDYICTHLKSRRKNISMKIQG